jgi:hypothetical protein
MRYIINLSLFFFKCAILNLEYCVKKRLFFFIYNTLKEQFHFSRLFLLSSCSVHESIVNVLTVPRG